MLESPEKLQGDKQSRLCKAPASSSLDIDSWKSKISFLTVRHLSKEENEFVIKARVLAVIIKVSSSGSLRIWR